MRRSDVPAIDPFIPALASVPSIAVVSSMLTPAALATGATYFIASAKLSISIAVELNDAAITSVTIPVCEASSPNARKVLPATSAARARSVSVA